MNLNNLDISKLDFSVIEDDLDSIYEQLDKIHKNKKLMKIYNEYFKDKLGYKRKIVKKRIG